MYVMEFRWSFYYIFSYYINNSLYNYTLYIFHSMSCLNWQLPFNHLQSEPINCFSRSYWQRPPASIHLYATRLSIFVLPLHYGKSSVDDYNLLSKYILYRNRDMTIKRIKARAVSNSGHLIPIFFF